MKHKEREVIEYMRVAISSLDTDHHLVRDNMDKASRMFNAHLMEWSDEFARLYDGMQGIYRAYTPMPKGRYSNRNVEIGYSSFSTSRWINDKEQPPKPTSSELVARFDSLISDWQ